MILPILTYNHPKLRIKSENVEISKLDQYKDLISDMWETMKNANGVGLAAPQVGENIKILVIEEEISDGNIFKGVFINPKIIKTGPILNVMSEGCLSVPKITQDVIRPSSIELNWYDENGKEYSDFFHGIEARILQHEIDHLDGLLFIDRLSFVERTKLFFQLEDIKNKKVAIDYPIYRKEIDNENDSG